MEEPMKSADKPPFPGSLLAMLAGWSLVLCLGWHYDFLRLASFLFNIGMMAGGALALIAAYIAMRTMK
jgi:hypothetical protein